MIKIESGFFIVNHDIKIFLSFTICTKVKLKIFKSVNNEIVKNLFPFSKSIFYSN